MYGINDLKFICVQPAIKYYTWQVEVMLNNFIRFGINPNNIEILCVYYNDIIPEDWQKLANNYNYIKFFFYKDLREKKVYPSSVRPNVLKQHFKKFPELEHSPIFYHDCDICFTQRINWNQLLKDKIWYLSDTNSYINADYIIKNGELDVYNKMCDIIGISRETPLNNNENSGGAQYLMKGVTSNFWDKVEKDCEKLYDYFIENEIIKTSKNPNYNFQKWTADMWAVLWNIWYFGFEAKNVSHLDFSFATNSIDDWNSKAIFHNAGVDPNNPDKSNYFFKGDYQNTLPYNKDFSNVNKFNCSYKYVEEIIKTSEVSCLLDKEIKIEIINNKNLPKVSCYLTTYRRFNCLERSIAMFLAQDYKGETELIIYNTDVDYPVSLDETFNRYKDKIKIINNNIDFVTKKPYNNIGAIRRDAFSFTDGEYVICWDDDDIFLPWNIRQGINKLRGKCEFLAWKPKVSLFNLRNKGIEFAENIMEASFITYRKVIEEYGYRLETGSEHLSWYNWLMDNKKVLIDEDSIPGYCFNWGDEGNIAGHKQSGDIKNPNNFENHKKHTTDIITRPIKHIELNNIYKPYFNFIKQNVKTSEFKFKSYLEQYL